MTPSKRFSKWTISVVACAIACTHTPAATPTSPPLDIDSDAPPPRKPAIASSSAPPGPAFIEYRYFPTAKDALLNIVATTRPRIIGFGEYHAHTDDTAPSALSRFSNALLPAISRVTSDVVVEALVPTGDCRETQEQVAEEVKTDTARPESTEDETTALFRQARTLGVFPHFLTFSCRDHEAVYGGDEVDYLTLLQLIGDKLTQKTTEIMGYRAGQKDRQRPLITIDGGAVHNDAAPDPNWQSVAFGPALAKEVPPGKYVEIDLVVPELAADNRFVQQAPWFPLFRDKAAADRALLIKQSETSYIIVFRRVS